jgi:CRP/FNR family transcriptional regulator
MNLAVSFPISVQPHHEVRLCTLCGARLADFRQVIPGFSSNRLTSLAVSRIAKPSFSFIEEGGPAASVFTVLSGTVRICKLLADGRRQIVGFAGAGHCLGLSSADDYRFSAEAIGVVHYRWYSKAQWLALIEEAPSMGSYLLEAVSNELARAQDHILLLGRKDARERMASFLAARSRVDRICPVLPMHFTLPMTRVDIADYLGLSIETTSRTLTKLRSDGIIGIGRDAHGITIFEPRALAAIADGLY